jgi:hypothetical protein
MKNGDEERLNKRLLFGEQQSGTKALAQDVFDSLEAKGLVRKTGHYRWGEKWGFQPVYDLTELGRTVTELLRDESTASFRHGEEVR